MKFVRSLIATVLLTGFTTAWASPSMSFVAVGGANEFQHLKWRPAPIKLSLSASLFKTSPNIKPESDIAGAVKRAAEAWSSVAEVEFRFDQTERSGVSPAGASGDGVNLITIAPSPENVLFFARDAQASAAKTRVFYDRKGQITEADIALNPFQPFSTDGTYGTYDLQTALTHEIGHLLGLRHSEVAGSIMADNIAKNSIAYQLPVLSESDVAAVREIYGGETEDCCSKVSGVVTLAGGRAAKGLRVWAEESESGRVTGQSVTLSDGSYAIGGLNGGSYKLYWKAAKGSAAGELGSVDVDKHETASLDGRVSIEAAKFSLEFIGLDDRLAESAIDVSKLRESIVSLAGKDLDAVSKLTVTSPYLHIDPVIDTSDEVVDGRTMIRFYIQADAKTPAGVYSLFASSATGQKTSLVGVLRVR